MHDSPMLIVWVENGPNVNSVQVEQLAKFFGKYIAISTQSLQIVGET